MHRRASVLFLGLFAVAAALQGAAACTSNATSPAPGQDSGQPVEASAGEDTGVPTGSCTGPLPVMTVIVDGGQVAPDWSCYGDASFLFRPLPDEADGGEDASDAADASSPVDAADSAPPIDASPPPQDAAPPPDASPDAGADYVLKLTDFVSGAPPVNATVSIVWGTETTAPAAFTGTVNSQGLLYFPPPPPNTPILSYYVEPTSDGDAGPGEAALWWVSAVVVPPPGATSFNSLTVDNLNSLTTSVLGNSKANKNLASIVTAADDCQYRDVIGGQYILIDDATNQPVPTGTGPGDARAFYLQDNLPDTECTFTTNIGGRSVWSMINAPTNVAVGATSPPTHTYHLQFWGRMFASQTAAVLIDSTAVESYPGTVTVVRSSRLNASPPN
jgi:hypothetical protein